MQLNHSYSILFDICKVHLDYNSKILMLKITLKYIFEGSLHN